MARGRINHERWIQHYLGVWMSALRRKSWTITWELVDDLRNERGESLDSECDTNFKARTQHIRFNRSALRTKRQIEIAVNHEILHTFGKGARGRDEDIIFNRLDRVLVHTRLFFSRASA